MHMNRDYAVGFFWGLGLLEVFIVGNALLWNTPNWWWIFSFVLGATVPMGSGIWWQRRKAARRQVLADEHEFD